MAQSTGQLGGQVVDASDLAIPEANVSLLLPGGEKPIFAVVTGKDGLFTITSIRPDVYDVTIEKAGFQKQVLRNVRVEASQNTLLPKSKLEVQTVRQSVDVIATVATVQSSSVDVSSTITNAQIQRLPMIDRNPLALITTQAGVSDGRGPTVINGQRTSFSSVTLDGINIQDNLLRSNGLSFIPNRIAVDQLAEITVTTSNASATVSGGGSHITMVTPSGTNQYHGSLYWYNRNSRFAANDWFNNRDGIKKPFLNQNQFGAALGGPIIKDKLLFYGNYEGLLLRQQTSQNRTILTTDARNGIFTYVAGGATQKVNILQAMGISPDPATQAIIAQVPDGTKINNFRTGDSSETLFRNTGGYSFVQRDNTTRDNVLAKLDFHPTSSHAFAGTFTYNHDDVDRGDVAAQGYTVAPKVMNTAPIYLMSLAWRWNPTPYLTNEVRGGFNLAPAAFKTTETFGSAIIAPTLISNPLNTFRAQGRDTDTYNYADNASWSRGSHLVQFGFQGQKIRTSPYLDAGITPTYTLGMGTGNPAQLTATHLPGIGATDLAAANSLLALLGGYVTSSTQTFNITSRESGYVSGATNLRHFKFDQNSLYVQDKWKMFDRLTLTLGLRYDYFGVIDEKDGLFLLPQIVNNSIYATLLGNSTLDFAGSGIGKPWYNKDWNNFAPQIGVALDPTGNGKTVLRGGFGVSYLNDEHIASIRNNVTTSGGLNTDVTRMGLSGRVSAGLTPIVQPTFKVPRTFAENYALNMASAFGLPDPDLATPYIQEWNLEAQHDLKGVIIQARYVGNHQVKSFRAYDLNQVIIKENGFLDDFNRAQSNGNLARAATGTFNPAYNAAIPGSQVLTVFPNLASGGLLTNSTIRTYIDQGQVGELANTYQTNALQGSVNFYRNPVALGTNVIGNAANSTYHAFQLDVRKRLRSLEIQGNYTASKVLSNAVGTDQSRFEPNLDNANPALENGRPPYDISRAFKANGVYDLPAGRNHWFNPFGLNALFGGWSTSAIMTWQSGVPFSILSARGTVNRGGRSTSNTANAILGGEKLDEIVQFRMSPTGPYMIAASAIGPDGRGVAADGSAPFNGQVFFHPTAGTNGTLQRRVFNGPSVFNMDFAVGKRTQITEGQVVEIRMEASNIFNNATFQPADMTISSTTFGKITGTFYDRRLIQFSAHYRF